MAVNKPYGDNARKGAVRERSQVLNPKTNLYVKRNANTGQFMDVKTTGGKFKGVRTENKTSLFFQNTFRYLLVNEQRLIKNLIT